ADEGRGRQGRRPGAGHRLRRADYAGHLHPRLADAAAGDQDADDQLGEIRVLRAEPVEHAGHLRQPRRLRQLPGRRPRRPRRVAVAAGLIAGRVVVSGDAEGEALVSSEALSFWGGYDFHNGAIIDRHHPLVGVRASGLVLAVPFSKGSSTTTAVLLEAVRAETAPAAIVTTGPDSFFALASIVAETMYGRSFPVVALDSTDFASLRTGERLRMERDGRIYSSGEARPGYSMPLELDRLTGLASRFGAFVAERHPFALDDALSAYERSSRGREPRSEAEVEALRGEIR